MDEPKTREEMFLAKAAGEDVSLPAPITCEEKYLKAIAEKGGGGGTEYTAGDNIKIENGVISATYSVATDSTLGLVKMGVSQLLPSNEGTVDYSAQIYLVQRTEDGTLGVRIPVLSLSKWYRHTLTISNASMKVVIALSSTVSTSYNSATKLGTFLNSIKYSTQQLVLPVNGKIIVDNSVYCAVLFKLVSATSAQIVGYDDDLNEVTYTFNPMLLSSITDSVSKLG